MNPGVNEMAPPMFTGFAMAVRQMFHDDDTQVVSIGGRTVSFKVTQVDECLNTNAPDAINVRLECVVTCKDGGT